MTLLLLLSCLCGLSGQALAQHTLLASHDAAGDGGDANSNTPRLSEDGRLVAFVSAATNLVPGDTNGVTDVFCWDRTTDLVERVSVSSLGVQADSFCSTPSLSADGRFVAFASSAANLVPGDTNGVADVFRHDRLTGLTVRVSTDAGGGQVDGASTAPWVSANGRFVAFTSSATNLVPGDVNGLQDVFVKDLITGAVSLESVAAGGVQATEPSYRPVLSADGRKVAFHSAAANLTPADSNGLDDVFLRDRLTGLLLRVSVGPLGLLADGASRNASLAADGLRVAFETTATNLDAADTNGLRDIYLFDTLTGQCSQVTQSEGGRDPSLSGDGLRVAFTSDHPIHPLDQNGVDDAYLRVLDGGVARLNLSSAGVQGNGSSGLASLDGSGRRAAFVSSSSNLVGAVTSGQQVFLRDTQSAWTDLGQGLAGVAGVPRLLGSGTLLPDSENSLSLIDAAPSAPVYLVLGVLELGLPFKFGTLVPSPDLVLVLGTTGAGTASLPFSMPPEDWSGVQLFAQAWILDGAGPVGWAASNGLRLDLP